MELQTGKTQVQTQAATGGGSALYLLFKIMRPRQWIKNLIIFGGIIFAQKIFIDGYLLKTFYAFVAFCILSGSVYIINDLVDIEKDKAHPRKKYRPLASGQLSVPVATAFVVLSTTVSLGSAFILDVKFGFVALAYFVQTLAYSFILKNVVIIDVLTIAVGFVLRAVAGAVVIAAEISPWLLLCTFLLALFMALTKRRNELLLLDSNARTHRKILDEYQPAMLDQMISVVTSSTVMAYSLYTFTSGHSVYLMTTIPFVVYGIFRYQYLVYQKDMGGAPEVIFFKDRPLLINVILWVVTSAVILYLT